MAQSCGWRLFNYHAVPGNLLRLDGFRVAVCRLWRQALKRRSQRNRLQWSRFGRLADLYIFHADETPVQMLAPGMKKTQRAYVWAYVPSPFADFRAAVYDFSPSRAGEHARRKFYDLHVANNSQLAEQALRHIGQLYDIEREVRDLLPDERQRIR